MPAAKNALKELEFRNFSGGINTRDWSSELTGNEFPYSSNVTVDERGGAQKRLGYEARYAATAFNENGREFNGTTDYYSAVDSASLSTTDTFTIIAWARPDAVDSRQIYSKGTGAAGFFIDSGGVLTLSKAGTGTIVTGGSPGVSSTWKMMVAAKDGASAAKIYINAVDVSSAVTNQTIVDTATDLNIGRNTAATNFWDGGLDEVAIFDTYLSAANISALYAARGDYETYSALVLSFSPKAYYHFGLSPLTDSSGNANTLTAGGAPAATKGPVPYGLISNLFYWATRDQIVSQQGRQMVLETGDPFHTWTTSARCGMTEFLGNLLMIHPVDGLKMWDGATVTTPTNAPIGNTCATWQNKLWSGGDPANPSRLYYSDIGSANRTNATQYVDIREKDSALITALGGASGIDISGRPGLLVFKQDSAYRVHDSATGAFTTIDSSQGAGSNIAVINAYGRTFVINTRGIYSTDGLDPLREESSLVENLFSKTQINQGRPDLMAAGRYQDRLFFSFPRAAATANNQVLELHPVQGWVVPHTNAAAAYASIVRNVNDLVFASPSLGGKIYNSHKGGTDDGVAITSALMTRWLEPAGGYLCRIRRARFVGNGSFMATVLQDYETAGSLASLSVVIDSTGATYDAGDLYDDDEMYGPTAFQGIDDHHSIGVVRAMSVLIEETSSLTTTGRPIVAGGVEPEQGAWSLASIKLLAIDLGIE